MPSIKETQLLWRMIDANFNRCSEGLRVLEDWSRFVADDAAASQSLKALRHQLHLIAQQWPLRDRLLARNSAADVGRTIETSSEYQRPETTSLLHANFYRVQQSLRVLEETTKRLGFDAKELEQLRYTSYELQKSVLLSVESAAAVSQVNMQLDILDAAKPNAKSFQQRSQVLKKAQLYVLTDGCSDETAFVSHLTMLAESGVDVIQLRAKHLNDRTLFSRAQLAAKLLAATSTLFIVNDRPDIAIACQADGVHVGQDELPVEQVRRIVGTELLIGLSTHDMLQIQQAHQTSANYIGVGPVFPSTTKSFDQPIGTDTLSEVIPIIEMPAFAIGGINQENINQVLATKFSRVVVQNAAGQGADVYSKVSALKKALQQRQPQ